MRQPVQEDPGWQEIFLRRLPGNAFGRWNYVTNFWRGALGTSNGFGRPASYTRLGGQNRSRLVREGSVGVEPGARLIELCERGRGSDPFQHGVGVGVRHRDLDGEPPARDLEL